MISNEDQKKSTSPLQDQESSPPTSNVTTVAPPIFSQKDYWSRLLRDNKLVIAIEVILVASFLYSLPLLRFVNAFAVFLFISALLWLRNSHWSAIGLALPVKKRRTLLLGVSFGLFFVCLQSFVLVPLFMLVFHQRSNVSTFTSIRGNVLFLSGYLLNTWTVAAFAEEMMFRGYLLNRIADLFNRNPSGWAIAIIAQAALFGAVHAYEGLVGMLVAGTYAVLAGLLYLRTNRNLWADSIGHGVTNTIFFLVMFAP